LEARIRALAEYIIPYFNEVKREIASRDFSFGVSELNRNPFACVSDSEMGE